MTDPSGLTPEHDAVRRLLADARHDGPVPPEVAARLDDTLASLVSERAAERASEPGSADDRTDLPRVTPAPVVDLGARRRRTAGLALLAAAAVVVAGVAIGQGLPRLPGGDTDGSAAGGDTSLAETEDSAGASSQYDGGAADQGPESLKSMAPAPQAGVPTLSSSDVDLDDDLLDLRSSTQDDSERLGAAETLSNCDLRGIGPGRRVVAVVDGQLGIVVFRRADGSAQQAELYVCGSPDPVRTLTLPAP